MDAVKSMTEKIQETIKEESVEASLNNNVLNFEINDVKYRVSKPTFSQKQAVYKKKAEKFTELMKDKSLMMESDWIKIYKERNIDIEELNTKMLSLEKRKQDLQNLLGKEIEGKASEEDLKKLRDEIASIQDDQSTISVQKTTLLQFSIEYQLNIYIYSLLTVQVAEKEIDNKWVKVWNSFEEFQNYSDEEIVNKVTFYASLIIRDEIIP